MGHSIAVLLEGAVDDIRAKVHKVRHCGLRHGTVPRNISWLSLLVPVDCLVVLMEDGVLSHHPFSVGVLGDWQLRKNLLGDPVVQVGVVQQRPIVERVSIKHKGSREIETSGVTSDDEVDDVEVANPAPHVEVLDGKFSHNCNTKDSSESSVFVVVSVVEIRLVSWSRGDLADVVSVAREPTGKESEVSSSLV